MRLAPNGKIYALAGNFNRIKPELWTITQPDKKGALCRIVKNTTKLPEYNISFPNVFNPYTRIKFSIKEQCKNTLFQNLSDTNYFKHFTWYFGDGDSAVGLNAQHQYKTTGKYFVKLKAAIPEGYFAWFSDTVHFQASDMVKAKFGFRQNTGCQWVGFQFNDNSLYNPNKPGIQPRWLWNFGDGQTSTAQHPNHIYTKPGKYLIQLIFTDGFCTDTFLNTQGITIYLYTFSDGRTDTIKNPQVTFTKPGTYKILQAITCPTGCITYDSAEIQVFTPLDATEESEINLVTIKNDGSVLINWKNIPHAKSYHLSRSTDNTNWTIIASLRDTFLVDTEAKTQEQSYFYRMVYMDSCGNQSQHGQTHRTILLQAKSNEPNNIFLNWNFYVGWLSADHDLQFHAGDSSWQSLTAGAVEEFIHTDYAKGERRFSCYRVKAAERTDTNLLSYSNINCVPLKTIYFIPNAFSPNNDGLNDAFEIEAIGVISAEISIYNRWHVRVYENKTGEKISWDGKHRGKLLPNGLYYYTLTITGSNYEKIHKTGTVVLLK